MPWDSTAIVVLDQWILNNDRHDENLAYLPSLGVAAFDHDCALFGANPSDPLRSLELGRDQVLHSHELGAKLRTAEHFEYWLGRADSIGAEEVRRAVWRCYDAGLLSATERDALVDWLLFRQSRVRSYIEQVRDEFVSIDDWALPVEEVTDGG
jgi:hypothetical protein